MERRMNDFRCFETNCCGFQKTYRERDKIQAESQLWAEGGHLERQGLAWKANVLGWNLLRKDLESMVYPSYPAKENYPNPKWFSQHQRDCLGNGPPCLSHTQPSVLCVSNHILFQWPGEGAKPSASVGIVAKLCQIRSPVPIFQIYYLFGIYVWWPVTNWTLEQKC